jgi:Rrf2 family protein
MQLAQSDSATPVPCSKLAARGEMPERFLLQILRILVTHGILKSTRGVEGGYSLTRPADQISLLEIIEAIDGPLEGESVSAMPTGDDEESYAKLSAALNQITRTAKQQLHSIKLSTLLEPPPSPPDVDLS